MLQYILELIFPRTARERNVERLANDELTLQLSPKSNYTTAKVQITTLTEYDSAYARELIYSLKFHNSRTAAHVLALVLQDYLTEFLADETIFGSRPTILVPVPISKKRLHERGFNQIERILYELVKLNGSYKNLVHMNILKRTKHTTPQTKLKRKERLLNLSGAFTLLDPKKARTAHVVVIDDIATTGATLAEIKRTLEVSGCKQITLLAIARA